MFSRSASPLALVGILLLAMVSFQCGAALAKQLFPLIGAQGATALRLGLGTLILWIVRRPWRRLSGRTGWGWLLGYGLTLGVMNLCFYMALRTIPLGIAVALEFVGPLAVAIVGSRRAWDFLWVGFVLVGFGLLLPWRTQAHVLDPVGVIYAMGSAGGWAAYILLGRRAGAAFGGDTVALGSAIGALVAVPVGVAHTGMAIWSAAVLPYGLGLALLSSAVPYSLEMYALTRLPARTVGILMCIEPALGALLGLALLGEQLSTLQWLAITAIITASVGTMLGARNAPVEATQRTEPVPLLTN
jgi:inner membrane transporter RhtA